MNCSVRLCLFANNFIYIYLSVFAYVYMLMQNVIYTCKGGERERGSKRERVVQTEMGHSLVGLSAALMGLVTR